MELSSLFWTSSSICICLSKLLILSSSIFAGPYSFMLSANLISILSPALCKSLMRTLNRPGSRTDSCGILHITFFQLDRGMLITILWIQLPTCFALRGVSSGLISFPFSIKIYAFHLPFSSPFSVDSQNQKSSGTASKATSHQTLHKQERSILPRYFFLPCSRLRSNIFIDAISNLFIN